MPKKNNVLKYSLFAAASLLFLAIVGIILYVALPLAFQLILGIPADTLAQCEDGVSYAPSGGQAAIMTGVCQLLNTSKSLLAALIFVFIVLPAIIWPVPLIAALWEIAHAKNETSWKLLWALASLILGLLGLILYWYIGRKELRD